MGTAWAEHILNKKNVCDEISLSAVFEPSMHLLDAIRYMAERVGVSASYYNNLDDFFGHDMDAVLISAPAGEYHAWAVCALRPL